MIDLSNKTLEKNKVVSKPKLSNKDLKNKHKQQKAINNTQRIPTQKIEIRSSNRHLVGRKSDFFSSPRFIVSIISIVLFIVSIGLLLYLAFSATLESSTNNLIFFIILTIVNLVSLICLGLDLFKFISNNDLNDIDDEKTNFSYIRIFSIAKFIGVSFGFIILISTAFSLIVLNNELSSTYLKNKDIYSYVIYFSIFFNVVTLTFNILSFFESKFSRGIFNE